MKKTYSELVLFPTFEERYKYLLLDGVIGKDTFGSKRYLNQMFYNSNEWRNFKRKIILRDNGCDLGVLGFEIYGPIHVHHINPITPNDILDRSFCLLDPENVICVSEKTHKLLTYGAPPPTIIVERFKDDTVPWKSKE